jgi:hypothetical protein
MSRRAEGRKDARAEAKVTNLYFEAPHVGCHEGGKKEERATSEACKEHQ